RGGGGVRGQVHRDPGRGDRVTGRVLPLDADRAQGGGGRRRPGHRGRGDREFARRAGGDGEGAAGRAGEAAAAGGEGVAGGGLVDGQAAEGGHPGHGVLGHR